MSSYELDVRGGKETVTVRNADGSVQSVTTRNVTPEIHKAEMYDMLHTGTCSVCLSKDSPVNKYNVCEDCDTADTDYGVASVTLSMLFNQLNNETIYQYTSRILKAKTADDMQNFAKEFTEFCLSCGIAGRAYIEGFVLRMTAPTKYNTAMEKTYQTAFAWWAKKGATK